MNGPGLKRLLWVAIALCLWTNGRAQSPTGAPVVLITIDTLRFDHLPMGGATDVRTPSLQEIADNGIVFTQAISTNPLTLPAHASLLTGTYPHFHGVRDNSGYRLTDAIPTLAQTLKQSGYRTGAFLGSAVLDRSFGLDRGFDHYGDRFDDRSTLRGVLAERTADQVVDETLAWLEKMGDRQPFFLWVHLYDPHSPYQAPGRFSQRGYKGEIEYVDTQIERLVTRLKARGWFDSSLIVVLSDHGEDLNEHGEPTHGFFIYDTVLHIPLIIKLPANRQAGQRVESQVRIIDVAPTIQQVLRLPPNATSQGSGLLRLAMGREETDREAYSETLYPNLHFGFSALFSLRNQQYKFIDAPQPELYDILRDPGETTNLAGAEAAMANQLQERLQALRSRFKSTRAPQKVSIDPQLQERLRSLGYAAVSSGRTVTEDLGGPDPKSKVSVYAEIYRGMEAYTERRLEPARRHFLTAVKEDPEIPLAHDYLGSTYLAAGQLAEAIESYHAALRLAPERAETASNLAFAYLRSGKLAEAIAGFQLVTQLQESDWQAWHLLGVAHLQKSEFEAAVTALKAADERAPRKRDVLYNLGTAYQQQGQFLLAVEVFRKLVAVFPQDAEGWNSLASNYQSSGLMDAARSAFDRAIDLKPDYAAAYFNYGNLMAQRQELKQAESFYLKAIQADAKFALAYRNLAAVLQLQGREAEAEPLLRRFQELTGQ